MKFSFTCSALRTWQVARAWNEGNCQVQGRSRSIASRLWGFCVSCSFILFVRAWIMQGYFSAPPRAFIDYFLICVSCPSFVIFSVVGVLSTLFIMPCSRGLSRSGRYSVTRGQSSHPAPEAVEPLTAAPPSPRPLNLHNAIPMNSQQSFRYMFQSSLNKPLVIVNFTISVSEEPNSTLSPSSPLLTVNVEANVLFGDMSGVVFQAVHMQEDPPAENQHQMTPEPILQQPVDNVIQREDTPAPEKAVARKPARIHSGWLHLVTHPDGTPVFDENDMVTWLPSPSPESDEVLDSPTQSG